MLLSDYIAQVQFLVHDSTNADFSQTELTNAINNARTAVSLDFHCVRQPYLAPPNNAPLSTRYTPVGTITNTEGYALTGPNGKNGQVVGINVTAGGNNYSPATVVTVTAPTATFTGTIAAGVLTVTSAAGVIIPGQTISSVGVSTGTLILSNVTGTGGNGTYNVTPSQTVGPVAMAA